MGGRARLAAHPTPTVRPLLLVALAALTACARSPDPGPVPGPDPAAASESPADRPGTPLAVDRPREPLAADRPETVQETISIEGVDEPITLRLATFPEAPLPFSTYVPDGWATDVVGSGEGTAVQLTSGEAMLSLFVPTHTTSREGVVGIARAVAESRGGARPLAAVGWGEGGFSFVGDPDGSGDAAGTVWVGEHAGTWFTVVETYPIEAADGFAPRARVVLDRLRWLDDGTAL